MWNTYLVQGTLLNNYDLSLFPAHLPLLLPSSSSNYFSMDAFWTSTGREKSWECPTTSPQGWVHVAKGGNPTALTYTLWPLG